MPAPQKRKKEMEKLDTIARVVELVLAVVTSAVITRIITIRQRVRQEHAAADKAEADVKKDQIENIEAIVEKVYKPTIDTLTRQVADLRAEVDAVRKENEELKQENADLRDVLREIRPDIVPSRRSENAQRQTRDSNGRFAKQESVGGDEA